MKESTAIKKLNALKRSSMIYAQKAVLNPNDEQSRKKIKVLRAYAKQLIIKKGICPARFSSLFFEKEYREILRRTDKIQQPDIQYKID